MKGESNQHLTVCKKNHCKQLQLSWLVIISILLIMVLSPIEGYSTKSIPRNDIHQNDKYYEFLLLLEVSNIGSIEISSVMFEEEVFLSVSEIFNFLRIRNIPSTYFDSISGFVMNPESKYVIDRLNNRIEYKKKVYQLKDGDLLQTETNLYMAIRYFGEIFGLECLYNLRRLSVTLNTNIDLPIIRDLRLKAIRKNLHQITKKREADTIYKRNNPLFSFGMVDWSIHSVQRINERSNTRFNIALGSILAGGETNIALKYNSSQPLNKKDFYYRWRLANDDFKFIKQALVGKINPYSTSSIHNPVIGVQFTNTPTAYRRSFGSYTLSNYTEPGWTVELYVNNILVGYEKADASGFYSFEVPVIYGSTNVRLKFYGPWGEEQMQEQSINVPYSFVPKNKLEYKVTGGIVEDDSLSRYTRSEVNYGLSRHMTIGGGVEYLSSVSSGNIMPFLNTTLSLGGKLLFTANYTHNVMAKATLNYQFLSGIRLNLEYTKFKEGQTAIIYNYLEVRKLAITKAFRLKKFSLFSRISIQQFVLPTTKYTSAEFMLSGSYSGVSANITTYGIFSGLPKAFIYSNLSLRFEFLDWITLNPQMQYDFSNKKVISVKLGAEKRVFNSGYLTFSYENLIKSNSSYVQLGFRFDLPYAKTNMSVISGKNTSFTESVSGSLQIANNGRYIKATNRSGVGMGGVAILPFLDLNNNGVFDKSEPKVYGLDVKISKGQVEYVKKDTTIVITQLEPYTNYFIELGLTFIDNIAWRIDKKSIDIEIIANQIRLIEVPVTVVGEATGMVYLKTGNTTRGLGRILMNFYNEQGKKVAQTLTESDGYFSYMGLKPGSYIVKVDEEQLKKLKLMAIPIGITITILSDIDGDIVDDIEFTLEKKNTNTIKMKI